MSNMSEERIITVDEVQAAIDLETAELGLEIDKMKKATLGIIDQFTNLADHMNSTFDAHADAIKETQEKHNKLALMFTAFVEVMGKLDCIKGD